MMKNKIFLSLLVILILTIISCEKTSATDGKTEARIERFSLQCGETDYRGFINEASKKILIEGVTQSKDITSVHCQLSQGASISPKPEEIIHWDNTQTFTVTNGNLKSEYTLDLPDLKPTAPVQEKKVVIGYMPLSDWQFDQLYKDTKWNYLTHINVCFAAVKRDGSLNTDKVVNRIVDVRNDAHQHDVKILISFNKNSEGEFLSAISDPAIRKTLVKNIIDFTKKYQLDGFDIDYEDYRNWNRTALTQFAKELYEAKDENMLMTCAVVDWCDYGTEFQQYFDYINIMSYDKNNATGNTPVQHASYEGFVSDLTQWSTTFNAPKSKIVGGLPFYGYSWDTEHAGDDNRQIRYSTIVAAYPGAEEIDKTPNGLMYYNGKPTIRKKCKYVIDEEYAGVMIWQLFQDSFEQDKSLMEVVGQVMSPQPQQ